jgi:hypothetical protein
MRKTKPVESQTRSFMVMITGVVTYWLVVTNIALGVLTFAPWLALIVAVIQEMVQKRGNHKTIRRIGTGRMYVSESGNIQGM